MNHFARIFACLAPAALAVAQVSVSVTALTPLTATCTSSSGPVIDSRPAGPLPLSDFLLANTILASATAGHSCTAVPTSVSCTFTSTGSVVPFSPNGSIASSGPNEYLVTIQTVTTNRVALTVTFEGSTTTGTNTPLALVDIGNDGQFDFSNGTQLTFLPPLFVGPQPLLLRVRTEGKALVGGLYTSQLTIGVTPANDMGMTRTVIGCDPQATFELLPSFIDLGLELTAIANPSTSPVFAVFGFGVQPVLLPLFGQAPCLLLPRPDIVVPMVNSTLPIALPPAVRPLTFWVQGVTVVPQLLVTDCTRVDAF